MCLVIEGACGLSSFNSVHPKEWNEFVITARIFALSQYGPGTNGPKGLVNSTLARFYCLRSELVLAFWVKRSYGAVEAWYTGFYIPSCLPTFYSFFRSVRFRGSLEQRRSDCGIPGCCDGSEDWYKRKGWRVSDAGV